MHAFPYAHSLNQTVNTRKEVAEQREACAPDQRPRWVSYKHAKFMPNSDVSRGKKTLPIIPRLKTASSDPSCPHHGRNHFRQTLLPWVSPTRLASRRHRSSASAPDPQSKRSNHHYPIAGLCYGCSGRKSHFGHALELSV